VRIRGQASWSRVGLVSVTVPLLPIVAREAFGLSLPQSLVDDWLYNILLVACAGLCLVRGAVVRRGRGGWLLVGLALALWTAADIDWTIAYQNVTDAPFPSVADYLYLSFYPPLYAGLVLLLREELPRLRRSVWLDGLIGALSIAAVSAAVVLDAVLGSTGGSFAVVATNLAYPAGDLLLIALVVGMLGATGWRLDRRWSLLMAGLVLFAVFDSVYLYVTATGGYVSGGALDIGWPLAFVVIAWAACQPQRAAASFASAEGWRVLIVPATFGAVSLGVEVYDHFHRVNVLALGLATAALAALVARFALTFGENVQMLRSSRHEALTDPLTGLANRRQLMRDLAIWLTRPEAPGALVLLDLDGFKPYNDTFGHPAGDALLVLLAERLADAVGSDGKAYRMGGDEFCVLVPLDERSLADVDRQVRQALRGHGDGFAIQASSGAVEVPTEVAKLEEALRLADRRMYSQKAGGRLSAAQQTMGALLRALEERSPALGAHVSDVADNAERVARSLGLASHEIGTVRLAGALHDVGKMAIPDVILNKPGNLDEAEWALMRRHTIIGQRILDAPAMIEVGRLVRSSHERYDGRGYPDGLAGAEIPIGSRIVFVCDAFDAMTAQRPYGRTLSPAEALTELENCSGTQFDPEVVAAFAAVMRERSLQRAA
jgi:diguanylate cyclase (GGDEF)-like protein